MLQRILLLPALGCALLAQFHLPGAGANGSPATPKTTPSKEAPAAPTAPNASKPGSFDYYVLSLSWAPAFCADPSDAAANPKECAPGKNIGFIVHGLWPEANNGPGPESCGAAKAVPKAVLNLILPYMLSPTLVQHEWATHGTCSGLTPQVFFTDVIQARVAVQIPIQITAIEEATTESPEQIEAQFAGANPSFPEKAFRTACKGGNFSEIRVCFNRTLKAQECTPSPGECSSKAERILPPR